MGKKKESVIKSLCSMTDKLDDGKSHGCGIQKIIDNLYIADWEGAHNEKLLHDHSITHVINCTNNHSNAFDSSLVTYTKLGLRDSSRDDIDTALEHAMDFIDTALSSASPGAQVNILVHCIAGVSRSPTVVLRYMMRGMRFTLSSALDYLTKKRPVVKPNDWYMTVLSRIDRDQFEGGQPCEDAIFYREWREKWKELKTPSPPVPNQMRRLTYSKRPRKIDFGAE